MSRKILIAADHGGYTLKEDIKTFTFSQDIEWIDLGTQSTDSVDYPDYAFKMAEAMKEGIADTGILICRTGIGMSIAANRYPHVRASACANTTMAKYTRIDNDANILCLGASVVGARLAEDCIETFLTTGFSGDETGGERHQRRVDKLNCSVN